MIDFKSYAIGSAICALTVCCSPAAESPALDTIHRSVAPSGSRQVMNGKLSLREAVLTALERNPEIEIQREQQEATSHMVDVALAEFDSVVSADAGANYRRDPQASSELDGAAQPENDGMNASLGVDKKITTGGTVGVEWQPLNRSATNSEFATLNPTYSSELSLNLRQPLLDGAGRVNKIPTELALVNVVTSKHQVMRVIIDTLRDVEISYWRAGAAARELEIRRQGVELANVILEETMARDSSRVDELEAKSNVLAREAAVVDADKQLADATDELFRVLGLLGDVEPGSLALEGVKVPSSVHSLIDPEERYSQALKTSPQVAMQRTRIDQAELELERAKYETRPTLDLTASAGLLGLDGEVTDAWTGVTNQDGRFANAGIEFRIPWGSRAERARKDASASDLKRERLLVHAERLDLFVDVRQSCRAVEAALKRLESANAAVEVNEARFEEQRLRRRTGESSLRALLEAQSDFDESHLAKLQGAVEVLTTLARLRALDGQLPDALGLVIVDGRALTEGE